MNSGGLENAMTIAALIQFVIENLPSILFVAALGIAASRTTPESAAERYLAWLLLLSVGFEMIWGGVFHIAFPETSARFIGWQVSPFQFEVGMADLAIGIVAIASFWRSLEFKSAVVAYVVLFYIGVAFGHVHQAHVAGNFTAGNFGALLFLTVTKVFVLSALLWVSWRNRRGALPA